MNKVQHGPRRFLRAGLVLPIAAALVGVLLVVYGANNVYESAPLPSHTFGASAPSISGSPSPSPSPASQSGAQAAAAAATDAPVVKPLPASPAHPDNGMLYIDSLGITAPLVPETATDGSLSIPGDPKTVGVFVGNPGVDGTRGTTVLAGHVTFNSVKGALFPLYTITQGASVVTTDAKGQAWGWRVVGLDVVPRTDTLPAFSPVGSRTLVIVTCGGKATPTSKGIIYSSNVIVTAVPVTA